MSTNRTKTLKRIIFGLFMISIISIACIGSGVGNTDDPSAKVGAAIQSKVGAGSLQVADASARGVAGAYGASGASAGSYFPEYQKIAVDPAYKYLQMKPGDSESFTVTVTNNENKTIEVKPRILIIPYTQYFMNENWISINPSEKSLKSGEKVEFEAKVSIPKDASVGSYAVLLAFTDKVPEGDVAGIYPNFPGTMQLNVQVWVPPVVQILTPYVNDVVEAGKDYTYEIKLKNTGDKDISISPKIAEGGSIIYYGDAVPSGAPSSIIVSPSVVSSSVSSSGVASSGVASSGVASSGVASSGVASTNTAPTNAISSNAASSNAVTSSESPSSVAASIMAPTTGSGQIFGNEAISIEAPDKIKAGQTAVVKLKLAVPANAKGSYSGSLELHIDDPGISNGGSVPLNFRILPVLKEPYEITFEAKTNDPITIEVKAYQYGYGIYTTGKNRDTTASFSVGLKDPAGKEVKPVLASTKSIGSVSIVDNTSPQPYPLLEKSSRIMDSSITSGEGSYQGGTTTFVETYTAQGAVGNWTISILPKNTDNFEYSVTVGAAVK